MEARMNSSTSSAISPAVGCRLLPHHRENLRASGLTDETISSSEIFSSSDATEIADLLGWSSPAINLGPSLIIPFFNLDGSRSEFCRIRPDSPRANGGKYEQPKGAGLRAYFPPAAIPFFLDPAQAIGFVEGEKKALCATQAGCPAVGLTGVWAWQQPRSEKNGAKAGERKLLPDIANIPLRGRDTWICFDRDAKRNPNVNHARAELTRIFTDYGVRSVSLIDLPPAGRDHEGLPKKQGIDDFACIYGDRAVRLLVKDSLITT